MQEQEIENNIEDTEEKVDEKKDKCKKVKPPKNAELLEKIAELEAQKLYLQADYQNYRKRTAKDIADARVVGTANALEPFLTVNDFLAMAQIAAEKSDNIESIKQGILMIINQYNKAMEDVGVKKINSVGEKFDPNMHDALSQEFSETVAEGIIIKEFSCGYKLGERLLRPARVVVSKGMEPEEAPVVEAENAQENESENFQD